MAGLLKQSLVVLIEITAFATFWSISITMIMSVFTIALFNIPDRILYAEPDADSILIGSMLIVGPQLILARTIAWWYDQYQHTRRFFIARFSNGKKRN